MLENTQMEQQLYGAYWDDGLLDLMCGLSLTAVGILWWSNVVFLASFVIVLMPAFWFPLRRALVEPRAGFVEFSRKRKRRNLKWIVAGYVIFTAMACLAVSGGAYLYKSEGGDFVGSFINGVPGALTAILAFFAGWLTTARRFHVYALVLIISGVITAVTQWTPAVPFLCTGVVVQAMGTKLLYNFRRDADAFEQAA
ncbi:MAG: hypothetical protein HOM68_25945 [Gemmatimonadetes bacterium]|jgi:hypothetical protein|nr:hypothetical protein [Gemmatimonadota bacterium]MBT5060010.1 hypothetical protein [Gemmatimonadota bacterium]MBT5142107.1 hypothetical protein [Gemmatimonadota bacterium]MBT5589308.1 hypothetical protein [Gemmatimonadota bacterium]MBT5963042.1 hypothetical protein [Gemmatimonadota bacterium]